MMDDALTLGARYLGNKQCAFLVWAPKVKSVAVRLIAPKERVVALAAKDNGYFHGVIEGVEPGTKYFYRLDGENDRPDPASRHQPEGVHGPSAVVDSQFDWTDQGWFGLPLGDYVVYELHVGTFTPEGTFDAVIPHLKELKDLGITAIELMPVAQFPGGRNWGYDGVYPFAAQESYGGPAGLKRLVDACHREGLAVVLDVVYNHLGPEGNYMGVYGPYFTDRYRTPWGAALNFDGADSDEVRRYFLENALYWQTDCHIDALRLDAIHAICDFSATPFLEELVVVTGRQSDRLNRRFHLIAESDMDDARIIRPRELGGFGLHAQWSDDFHHALHVLLTGERNGYYADFEGVKPLAKVFREGWAFTGDYSPYRRRRHGNSPRENHVKQFVVCAQNHDQVGNRMMGDRLSAIVSFESLKLAAGTVILSPFIPMLFMGEEYGETAPFLYFTSHSDPALIEAVRKGRAEEFAAFKWHGEVPDPHAEKTFNDSRLNRALAGKGQHRTLFAFHRELLSLRRSLQALREAGKETMEVTEFEIERTLFVRYWTKNQEAAVIFCFADEPVELDLVMTEGLWRKELDSADERWNGQGGAIPAEFSSQGELNLAMRPKSLVLLKREATI